MSNLVVGKLDKNRQGSVHDLQRRNLLSESGFIGEFAPGMSAAYAIKQGSSRQRCLKSESSFLSTYLTCVGVYRGSI
ncbi:hypothetical protein J6590_002712 [Homalodisca vitripennis]|nr:hypothetical protein J6590_002712 [Homalodisca vitripennis]